MIITERFLQQTPILYLEFIKELIKDRKYRSRTDFVNEAIKEKLLKEGIDLNPKEKIKLEEWYNF